MITYIESKLLKYYLNDNDNGMEPVALWHQTYSLIKILLTSTQKADNMIPDFLQ